MCKNLKIPKDETYSELKGTVEGLQSVKLMLWSTNQSATESGRCVIFM
jgi:hypothetical protein